RHEAEVEEEVVVEMQEGAAARAPPADVIEEVHADEVVGFDKRPELPDLEEATPDTEDRLGRIQGADLALIDAHEEVHDRCVEGDVAAIPREVFVGVLQRESTRFEGEYAPGHGLTGGEEGGAEREEERLHGGGGWRLGPVRRLGPVWRRRKED
ncbi:hypothetical protein N9261_00345, partial [bacterium]|nr:hypothetical protein [bacterium]